MRKVLRPFNLRIYDKKLNDAMSKWSDQHRRKLNDLITKLLMDYFFPKKED